jgi:PKD repeat protein
MPLPRFPKWNANRYWNCTTAPRGPIGAITKAGMSPIRPVLGMGLPVEIRVSPRLINLDSRFGNNLNGSIPNFSGLPNLQTLSLGKNQLTSVPDFSALPQLQVLYLYDNQLTGSIPNFSHLTELKYLDLRGNAVCKNINIDYTTWSVEKTGRYSSSDITWQEELNTFPNCPIAQFTATPLQGPAPLTVALDGRASTDTDGTIASYSWWASDGQTVGGETPTTSLTFSEPGTYTINFGVGDNQGAISKTVQTTVTVVKPNVPPTAAFTLSATQGIAPLTVTLDASDSNDSDGTIVKYEWTINDKLFASVETTEPLSNTFTPGEYTITLTVTDEQGLTATAQQTLTVSEPAPVIVEPKPDSNGQAIIIAAGGAEPSNTLFTYSNDFVQRLYRLLKQGGFSDASIHYMNPHYPDIDLSGYLDDGQLEENRRDYPLFDPAPELTQAFAEAARNLKAGQQFVFYLHGHAEQDSFLITPTYRLSASYLRDLLATLPTDVQQIIILDSCYSGSFFDELKGVEGRILISSADDQTLAWNTKYASFTDTFLRRLRHGNHLLAAFQAAEDLIINDFSLFKNQQPWLDDDGDGQYTSRDGTRAAQIYLGCPPGQQCVHAAPPPVISQVHPRLTLADNTTTATLWINTPSSQDQIRRVQAVLINPEFSGTDYQGLETDFGRVELELLYSPPQQRYEVVYNHFLSSGLWRILYQIQNTDGVWSEMVQAEVQVPNLVHCQFCSVGLKVR